MFSFILTCLIIEATPGPNMAYLAIISMARGRSAGYATVAGIGLGLLTVGIVSSFGVATAIAGSPVLYQIMRWAGTAYLFWLAWDSWRDDAATAKDNTQNSDIRLSAFFKRGFVTNILNPKAYIFYIAILPIFIDPAQGVLHSTLVLTVVYALVATLVHAFVVVLGVMAGGFLRQDKQRRIVRRFLSVCLGLVAIWFFIKTAT